MTGRRMRHRCFPPSEQCLVRPPGSGMARHSTLGHFAVESRKARGCRRATDHGISGYRKPGIPSAHPACPAGEPGKILLFGLSLSSTLDYVGKQITTRKIRGKPYRDGPGEGTPMISSFSNLRLSAKLSAAVGLLI